MELLRSIRFERSYAKAPQQVRRAFDKQSLLLLHILHHPSLRAKKYDVGQDLWQARVNRSWRFYFLIEDDVYHMVDIVPHPK
jgi:mRNA interferase RelE/StbE